MDELQCKKEIELIRKEIYNIIETQQPEHKWKHSKDYIEKWVNDKLDAFKNKSIASNPIYIRKVWIHAYMIIVGIWCMKRELGKILNSK